MKHTAVEGYRRVFGGTLVEAEEKIQTMLGDARVTNTPTSNGLERWRASKVFYRAQLVVERVDARTHRLVDVLPPHARWRCPEASRGR